MGEHAGKAGSPRLAAVAAAHGERFVGGGNRPIRLDDPEQVWFVVSGRLDVFAARIRDDGTEADFKHLVRAGPGRLVFAAAAGGAPVLVAKGLPDTELRRVPRTALTEARLDEAVVEQVDAWVEELSAAVARDVTFHPRRDGLVATDSAEHEVTGVVSTRRGVVWLSSADGALSYLGTEDPDPDGPGIVPVTAASWVTVHGPARVAVTAAQDLHREGRLFAVLAEFHRLALDADDLGRRLLLADAANLRMARTRNRQRSERRARRNLFQVLDRRPLPDDAHDPALTAALRIVGRHEDIRFAFPPRPARDEAPTRNATIAAVLAASGVRARRVDLAAADRWWHGDSGALLAFRAADGAPVALVPGASGRYRAVDPHSGRAAPVDARAAGELDRTAWFFYQPLPPDRAVGVRPALRAAFPHVAGDLLRFTVAGALTRLATLAPPVLLGAFAGQVLPSGSTGALAALVLAMVLVAVTAALLRMLDGTAAMRLEGRAAARIVAALWDRLLNLPAAFFRRFTAGDLATRGMVFQTLRDQVSGIVAGALLSVLSLLPTFGLLFRYDRRLGWLGLAFGLASLAVTAAFGLRQLPLHRRLQAVMRRQASVLLQLIGGVAKLRASGAESTAFTLWAGDYVRQKRTEMRIGQMNERLVAFLAAGPLFASAALFAAAVAPGAAPVPVERFLAAYAAFMVFYAALGTLGDSTSAIAAIIPACEQVTPLLTATPRASTATDVVSELRGAVRLDNVTFRYAGDGPLILQGVSIHARPGEFIALVGESGCGKSTLFRLALGLEQPLSGAVYYDGRDLGHLNRSTLRRHVGMVVQDATLRPRTVLDNIIGLTGDLTLDDAWRAARRAAVDRDIAAMPMGMYTATGEAGAAFSGGQVQRIMLAGALAQNPSVLFLDEATNWLDNDTQAKVKKQIEDLSITRIVSAHRLSTIREADRIYVLQAGRVVQEGRFDELMQVEGVFRDLVQRQLA